MAVHATPEGAGWPADRPREVIESVGVISPGDRVRNLAGPLSAIGMDFDINPTTLDGYDAVVCDTPDREMFKVVLSKPMHQTPVVYRMRGDPFYGLNRWINSRIKRWAALRVTLQRVDGCIAMAPHQANKYRRLTGVRTHEVGLPIDPTDWPTVTHQSNSLRLVTLTNAVYWPKIQPLIEIAPIVDDLLDQLGGHWKIGSWSDGFSGELTASVESLSNVSFEGDMDAREELARSNGLIHFSNFDVLPNAILEGMAAGVPVITNDYAAFTQLGAPLVTCDDEASLRQAIHQLSDPTERAQLGDAGCRYVREECAPELIGQQLVDSLADFVGQESQ